MNHGHRLSNTIHVVPTLKRVLSQEHDCRDSLYQDLVGVIAKLLRPLIFRSVQRPLILCSALIRSVVCSFVLNEHQLSVVLDFLCWGAVILRYTYIILSYRSTGKDKLSGSMGYMKYLIGCM